jgi:SAM-dependent methyltransferase
MDAWSRFWRQGHTTTFGDYFDKGYAGPVKHWLDSLPEQIKWTDGPLNVLELCCGNGSLLPFLFSLERPFHYTGVDAAKVALPDKLQDGMELATGTVSLLGNTPIEALPESIQAISMALSIYGMEYSRLDEALAGLRPRMAPQGQLFALMHHSESIVAKMSARAVAEYDEADIESIRQALTTIDDVLIATGNIEMLKADQQAEQARKFMNGMGNKYIRGATMDTGNAFMADHVLAALRFFKLLGHRAEERSHFIDELGQEASAARERHQQMLSVAKSTEEMRFLADTMQSMGWSEVKYRELINKEDVIGWTLTASV